MLSLISLLLLSNVLLRTAASSSVQPDVAQTCREIAGAISSQSAVYWPESSQYGKDVAHYFGSNSASSVCSVEPGAAADVGTILQIVGKTRTPFAVKGGGHAFNPGFSSSPGVAISLSRFDSVVYHPNNSTVDVGAGLAWDTVYETLEPFNVTVVGGRAAGVGVAGFALGGGYSYLTNQYGLTVDTIESVEIVIPSGRVLTISRQYHPDLFRAVKGGYNNFGVVTKLTFRTVPLQGGQVWGGIHVVSTQFAEQIAAATAKFAAEVDDPKAALETVAVYAYGRLNFVISLFYDGPNPPSGMFDEFTALAAFRSDVSTRSYLSLIKSVPAAALAPRGLASVASFIEMTPDAINAVINETAFWGNQLSNYSVSLSIAIQTFHQSILSHAPVESSSYPPSRDVVYLPTCLTFQWNSADADRAVLNAAGEAAAHLTEVALSLGQDVSNAAPYGNYALAATTTTDDLYKEKLPSLKFAKGLYDPLDVMGLTGGWKI